MKNPVLNPEILLFLTSLEKNNNREWFEKNKKQYLSAKESFDVFVQILIQTAKSIDPGIGYLEPRDCTFRIYRDVRFSREKTPFKTNFGAYISKGGKNSDWAGFYFHLEPSGSFTAGGKWQPQGPALKAIREAILYDPKAFRSIIENSSFKKHFREFMGEKLKTAPQGVAKDHPDIDLLRFKSYVVSKDLSPELMGSDKLVEEIASAWKEIKKLNDFLNQAMEHVI